MQCKQKVQEANENKSKMKSSLGEWEMVILQKLAGGELMPSSIKRALEPRWQQDKERAAWFL